MILEVSWDGLWTLSFGLSQSHGHDSWLVCEVALSILNIVFSVIWCYVIVLKILMTRPMDKFKLIVVSIYL